MANKTISIPDDVTHVIDTLGMPFSQWVTEQLRAFEEAPKLTLAQQFELDATIADEEPPDPIEVGRRMELNAPW